jgi:hypothetical protein
MQANANQPHNMTTQSYWSEYGDAIIGRMKAEGATGNTDEEIRRCLGGCVAGTMLMETAIDARDSGAFQWGTQCRVCEGRGKVVKSVTYEGEWMTECPYCKNQ